MPRGIPNKKRPISAAAFARLKRTEDKSPDIDPQVQAVVREMYDPRPPFKLTAEEARKVAHCFNAIYVAQAMVQQAQASMEPGVALQEELDLWHASITHAVNILVQQFGITPVGYK